MYGRLEEICDEIDADPEIRLTILRGEGGKAFVAGTDIHHFQSFESGEDAIAYENQIDRVVGRLERLECTTVAVLQGVCAGGGAAIALACDFRWADQELRFGVPIARTLGNCLSISNVARLIDTIGAAKTKEVLMLGRMLNAKEALAAGAVNRVCSTEELESEVIELRENILAMAPLTLRASKVAIRRALEARRASPESSEDLIRLCYTSKDFHQAVSAFLNKEKHEWRGE